MKILFIFINFYSNFKNKILIKNKINIYYVKNFKFLFKKIN